MWNPALETVLRYSESDIAPVLGHIWAHYAASFPAETAATNESARVADEEAVAAGIIAAGTVVDSLPTTFVGGSSAALPVLSGGAAADGGASSTNSSFSSALSAGSEFASAAGGASLGHQSALNVSGSGDVGGAILSAADSSYSNHSFETSQFSRQAPFLTGSESQLANTAGLAVGGPTNFSGLARGSLPGSAAYSSAPYATEPTNENAYAAFKPISVAAAGAAFSSKSLDPASALVGSAGLRQQAGGR